MLNLRKEFNLKFRLFQEIIYSFSPYFYRRYFMDCKNIPANELKYLQEKFPLNTIEKIVLTGGGAVPYTAIFLDKTINPKAVVIIEKNKLASLAASRLLKKLNLKNFKVVNIRGEDYSEYYNSLVIVALRVTEKQRIIDKILNQSYNNILIIRQPLRKNIRVFESVSLNGLKYTAIKQEQDFESIVLTK